MLTVNIEQRADVEMKYCQDRHCWSEDWEQGKKVGQLISQR